jgi:hypothetical protein
MPTEDVLKNEQIMEISELLGLQSDFKPKILTMTVKQQGADMKYHKTKYGFLIAAAQESRSNTRVNQCN